MTDRGRLSRLADDPVVRVAAYYVLLASATALIWQVFPGLAAVFSAERLDAVSQRSSASRSPASGAPGATHAGHVAAGRARHHDRALHGRARSSSCCRSRWVYILTRQKKGFRQSVVQTLIFLPIVVAGVVLLVKNSVALAFSLGGIVAAVSFRNTLRDTKDAVYIFLAIGVGLAAGVQVMSAAAVMSFLFNVVILVFWYTDFGRAPSHLEGPRAARRLERSRALANRTGAFVSQLDREILQVDVAGAARRRSPRGPAGGWTAAKARSAQGRSQAARHGGAGADARIPRTPGAQIEAVLATQVKDWKFAGTQRDTAGGRAMLEYRVRLRKSVPGASPQRRAASPAGHRAPPASRRGNHLPA